MDIYGKCSLRKMTEDDLEQVLIWRNSTRIMTSMFQDHIITFKEHLAWFKRIQNNKSYDYQIFEIAGKPEGLVYFTFIDPLNNKCEWGFYIGREDLPKGTGTKMGLLGLKYIFEQRHLRKVSSEVLASNNISIHYHKKLGFIEEGRLIKHVLKNGHYEDVILMALFNEDWLRESSLRKNQ